MLLSLCLASCAASALAGVGDGAGGGSDLRMQLDDLTVDAFTTLLKRYKHGYIQMDDGHIVNVKTLYSAIAEAIDQNEIKIVNSKNDQECPLRDDGGSCVEFLSLPKTGQLQVDADRLARHNTDQRRLRRQMIHEAFRMARQNDRLYQYSRRLDGIVQCILEGNSCVSNCVPSDSPAVSALILADEFAEILKESEKGPGSELR